MARRTRKQPFIATLVWGPQKPARRGGVNVRRVRANSHPLEDFVLAAVLGTALTTYLTVMTWL